MSSCIEFGKCCDNTTVLYLDSRIVPDTESSNSSRITNTTTSDYTTSTASNDLESAVSLSLITEKTLNMIPTPWSTESWSSQLTTDSSSVLLWSDKSSFKSLSIRPNSSSSYGVPSPPLQSTSRITFTVFNDTNSSSASSYCIPPIEKLSYNSESGTLSSWTLESFSSTGLSEQNSGILKVSYPWSPCTILSGTDIYPSTVETVSCLSKTTLATNTGSGKKLNPFNYIIKSSNLSDNPDLDCILKGVDVAM